jgi:hypothetical protein
MPIRISTMSRLLIFIAFLLSTGSVQAQGGLRWLADSAMLHQVGCKYTPDSLIVSFTNTGDLPILLDTIDGPTSSWMIADPASYSNLSVHPGSVYTVKLYLKIPNRYRNEILVLHPVDGAPDTLKLREDIRIANLNSLFRDTTRFVESRAIGSTPLSYYNTYTVSGNTPYVVSSVVATGDTTFKIIRPSTDSLIPNKPGPTWNLQVVHAPTEYGSDTLSVVVSGGPCDSLYRFVLIVTTKEPSPQAQEVRWDYHYQMGFSSPCGKIVTATNRLVNTSDKGKVIDSVRIVGDTLYSLTSSPSNRITNFVLASGDTVTYSIAFGGSQTDLDRHDANLIAYVSGGPNDTLGLTAIFGSSRLTTRDTVYEFGLRDINENWEVYTTIDRAGRGSFTISEIRKEGTIDIDYTGIAVGNTISSQKSIHLSATSKVTGYQEGKLIIIGSECDTSLVITVRGTFDNILGVESDWVQSKELYFDGVTLHRKNADPEAFLVVYDVIGHFITSSTECDIDLSSLPSGAYIAITERGQRLKFVK